MLHSASHFFDLMLFLAGDPDLDWIQGTVTNSEFDPVADRWDDDLSGIGQVRFSRRIAAIRAVMCHLLSTSMWAEFAAIGSEGSVAIMNNGIEFALRRREFICHGNYYEYQPAPFPPYERTSPTVRLIRDLLQALETDGETRQGIRPPDRRDPHGEHGRDRLRDRRIAPPGRGAGPADAPRLLDALALVVCLVRSIHNSKRGRVARSVL